MFSRLTRLAAALVAALVVLTANPVPARASAESSYATAAFNATNARRVDHGRGRLAWQDCLQGYARRQAARMAAQRRMFHQDLRPVMRACHLSAAGENVAYGYRTGGATVRAWMNSSGHRANILNRTYRHVGLAARRSGGRWYVAQVFGRRA